MESFMAMRGKEDAGPEKTKTQLEGESRELSQQVENLRKDLAELGTTVRALAQEGSATAQRSVRETTDRIAQRGQELAEDARTAGQQAVE
jgi:peptidoglycan hydrolase CwlO-like protein